MSLDQMVYSKLSSAVGGTVGGRIYQRGTLGTKGVPARPDYPYVMYGAGASNVERINRDTRRSFSNYYDIFVYDRPGSFQRIKSIHKIILNALEALELMSDSDVSVTEVALQGYSEDQVDDVLDQFVISGTYTILAGYNK